MIPLINKRETGINLRKIMDERGLTVKDVQHYLGLGSVQSIYHWLNGMSMPTIDNLYALSELFQIPIDAIVCGNRRPFISSYDFVAFNSIDRRISAYYAELSEKHAA